MEICDLPGGSGQTDDFLGGALDDGKASGFASSKNLRKGCGCVFADRSAFGCENLGNVTGVSECLASQASNDEDYLTNSYTILNGFIWAIPVLGFIGTVIGLSDAVGGFGKVVSKGADIEELKIALGGVTGGLSVAFETTLIALVLALIVQLFAKFVNNQEELFMDDCADYCNRNIVAKMKNINLNPEENF
jgi:biopolymer transport protein ExbB/TolQ